MSQGLTALLVVLVLATAFGVLRVVSDGRFHGTRPVGSPTPPGVSLRSGHGSGAVWPHSGAQHLGGPARGALTGTDHELGERATLLQFSSAFCAPCRATRRVLDEVADLVPGVRHIEVDAEEHLALVRRLNILRTPTTLVLDAEGQEVSRASGAPRRDTVLATLDRVLAP